MVQPKGDFTEKFLHIGVFEEWYIILFLMLLIIGILPFPVIAITGDNPLVTGSLADKNSFDLTIVVKNIDTGERIAGARIYLDGGYEGVTSGSDGSFTLTAIPRGEHSIRVINRGYMENISTVHIPDDKKAIILLHPLKIIPIGNHGPVEERIDVVFVPSSTQYDCTKQEKINTDYYTANEENFRNDVDTLIRKEFSNLNNRTSKYVVLPENFQNHFNFYYYSDPGDFADAFNGCAGTLPEDFWEDAPFTDVAVIIYPEYRGIYNGPPCEPKGCASDLGPGVKSWFKTPTDSGMVFIHEAGHAIFGLIDTYCGETYYTENDPDPNVWSSLSGCILASKNNQWNPAVCRQIALPARQGSAVSCQKDFWRYDPDPDIMATSTFSGKFGNASTLHIRYLLDNINRWQL